MSGRKEAVLMLWAESSSASTVGGSCFSWMESAKFPSTKPNMSARQRSIIATGKHTLPALVPPYKGVTHTEYMGLCVLDAESFLQTDDNSFTAQGA